MWPAARKLCGTRVSLLPLSHRHAVGLASAAQAMTHLPKDCRVPHRDNIEGEISYLLERQADGLALPYCAIASDDVVLGMTGFARIDRAHRRLEIGGTWVRSASLPLFTEMMTMMLTYAFECADAMTVQMRAPALHIGYRHMLSTLGAELDGVLRGEQVSRTGDPIDMAVYSMTSQEWPMKRSVLLEKLA